MVIDRTKIQRQYGCICLQSQQCSNILTFPPKLKLQLLHVSAVLGWIWSVGVGLWDCGMKRRWEIPAPPLPVKIFPQKILTSVKLGVEGGIPKCENNLTILTDWQWRLSRRLVAVPPQHGLSLSVLRGERRNKYEPIIVSHFSQFSGEHGARHCHCLHQPGHADN